MHKYIDADALTEEYESCEWNDGRDCDLAENIVNKIPAADVEPVRHGRWKHGENFGGEYLECEACASKIRPPISGKYNFCPRCGAKMDEGNNV